VNGGNLASRSHLIAAGFFGDYMETWNSAAVFTLNEINGDLFDVVGLDVGSYFSNNNAFAAWTFRSFNGSTELFSLVNNQFLGRIDLGWTGLRSFTIQSSRGSAASAFDNIELVKNEQDTSSAVVSEPTSLAFFSLGGLALLLRSRRLKN
jgi:hypothetical protein